MLERPRRFEDVIGNKDKIKYIQTRLEEGTLHNFLILSGISGVGKTTVGKIIAAYLNCTGMVKPCGQCDWCKENLDRIFVQNKNTETVFIYKMTENSTPEQVKDIVANMKPDFLQKDQIKVLLLDEAHRMQEAAQDSLLVDTEYLDERVYVILMTTDVSKFKDTIMDRAVHQVFQALSPNEMKRVINKELSRRALKLENPEVMISMLINFAQGKPRKALQILNGIGTNKNVPMSDLKGQIEFLEAESVFPILRAFIEDSFIGINTIMNLRIIPDMHSQMIDLLVEAIRVLRTGKAASLSFDDSLHLREIVRNIPELTLLKFLREVSGLSSFNNVTLLSAFLRCHKDLEKIVDPLGISLSDEHIYSAMHRPTHESVALSEEVQHRPPSLDMLMRSADLLEEE